MKTIKTSFTSSLFVFLILALSSCEEERPPRVPLNNTIGEVDSSLPEADGVLIGVMYLDQANPQMELNFAQALFYNNRDESSLVGAGSVFVNGTQLTNTGGVYTYTGMGSLGFDDGVEWEVSGSNNVPAFTHPMFKQFPVIGKVNYMSNHNRNNDLVIQIAEAMNYDELELTIDGLTKKIPRNTKLITITSAELMANTNPGVTDIILEAAVFEKRVVGGDKNFYFINLTGFTGEINFTE